MAETPLDYESPPPPVPKWKRLTVGVIQLALGIVTVVAFWRAYDAIVNGPSGSGSAMTTAVRYAEVSAAVGIVSLAALLFSLFLFRR
jgi:hypothetical protein